MLRGLLAAVMAFLMLLITVDVVARYFFSAPVPGTYEIVQITLGTIVFLGLPLVSWRETHISVALLEGRFRGRVHRVRRFLVLLVSCGILAGLAWRLVALGNALALGDQVLGAIEIPLAPFAYFAAALTGTAAVALLTLLFSHVGVFRANPPSSVDNL